LNQTVGNRVICKQECMVLGGGLELVKCSERVVYVSLSGWYKIKQQKSGTVVAKYRRRHRSLRKLSLEQFFFTLYDKAVYYPHYTGAWCKAVYPVTKEYAKSVLLIHKPWYDGHLPAKEDEWVESFNEFLQSPRCPMSVKVDYQRVLLRHQKGNEYVECVNPSDDEDEEKDTDNIGGELQDLMDLCASLAVSGNTDQTLMGRKFERGFDYEWEKRTIQVSDIMLMFVK